jgi:hypothetical protein
VNNITRKHKTNKETGAGFWGFGKEDHAEHKSRKCGATEEFSSAW